MRSKSGGINFNYFFTQNSVIMKEKQHNGLLG